VGFIGEDKIESTMGCRRESMRCIEKEIPVDLDRKFLK